MWHLITVQKAREKVREGCKGKVNASKFGVRIGVDRNHKTLFGSTSINEARDYLGCVRSGWSLWLCLFRREGV